MCIIEKREYKYLNYALLFLFTAILFYPVFSVGTGINIKSCNSVGTCASCGVTRDIYDFMTSKHVDKPRNESSMAFLSLILFQVFGRVIFVGVAHKEYKVVIPLDIITTVFTLIGIFYLFNH
jgi:hypothetical protein